jgi:hypothetical protein
MVHKFSDVLYVCTVACAAIFIQPTSDMEDLGSGNAFGLTISLAANVAVLGAQKLEILFLNENPKAKRDCTLSLIFEILPRLIMFVAAAIVAGIGCGSRCEIGSGIHDDDTDDYEKQGILTFYYVAVFIFGSHAFGTLIPLVLTLLKARPVTTIPWHTQVFIEIVSLTVAYPCLCPCLTQTLLRVRLLCDSTLPTAMASG